MAKDLLMEDYYAKRQSIEAEYNQKVNMNARAGTWTVISYPELPAVPTSTEIVNLSKKLAEDLF